MAVPPPTTKLLNLTVSPVTIIGGASIVDDQHNPASTILADAVNDWLQVAATPFTNGSALGSLSFWVKWDGTAGHFVNQRNSGAGAIFIWYISFSALGAITMSYEETESGNVGVITTSLDSTLIANTWTHIGARMSLTAKTIDLLKSGVEVSYANHNQVVGSPGATMTTPGTLGVMSGHSNAANFLIGGSPSRLKFWDNIHLTDPQFLEEYNSEFASIGSGFSTIMPIISSIITPISNRLIARDLYKK